MLLSVGRRRFTPDSSADYFHNYYEQQVLDQILRSNDRANQDPDFLSDVACVALNHLPPRYVRHDVDMTFFLSPVEMDEMSARVVQAVNNAVEYVTSREQERAEEADDNNDEPPEDSP